VGARRNETGDLGEGQSLKRSASTLISGTKINFPPTKALDVKSNSVSGRIVRINTRSQPP